MHGGINAGMGVAGASGLRGAETAMQERTFDMFLQRLSAANNTLAEARARLGAFNDRLSGSQIAQIGDRETNNKNPTARPENVEARLLALIEQFEAQANDLHSQIGRLERSA